MPSGISTSQGWSQRMVAGLDNNLDYNGSFLLNQLSLSSVPVKNNVSPLTLQNSSHYRISPSSSSSGSSGDYSSSGRSSSGSSGDYSSSGRSSSGSSGDYSSSGPSSSSSSFGKKKRKNKGSQITNDIKYLKGI